MRAHRKLSMQGPTNFPKAPLQIVRLRISADDLMPSPRRSTHVQTKCAPCFAYSFACKAAR